ncbi:MAG: acylphosphatase [Candidatus Micrarchaeota archaeon]
MACWKLVARGRVQGVNFRSRVKALADSMKLTGTVRNVEDGSVEIECSCSKEEIAVFAEKIRKLNWIVKVDSLDVTHLPEKRFDSFEILR